MNFLTNLAKGFVRSAVNQVGKDTGKIVSNKIYKDAHSTPIRGVTSKNDILYEENESTSISEKEFVSNQQIEGLKIQYFTTHPLLKTFYYVMGVFVTTMTIVFFNVYYALIPPTILAFIGICKAVVSRHQMTVYYTSVIPKYDQDKRYSTGSKISGHTLGRIETTTVPTKSFIIKSWIICVVYILYSVMLYSVSLHISSLENGDTIGMWSAIGKCIIIVLSSILIMDALFKKLP